MVVMANPKKYSNILKSKISEEFNFIKGVLSLLSLPSQNKDEDEVFDFEMVKGENKNGATTLPKRAKTITELEERLQKIKSQKTISLKTKLAKKSLSSKVNKKMKKMERQNKGHLKPIVDEPLISDVKKQNVKEKLNANIAKPVFNTEGKLVFSKFDFADIGKKERSNKQERDPKKILENLEKQKEQFRKLEENEETSKLKEIKEKMAWKNILQKAEGQKIKDDPTLLKKSIKKMEQQKKHSKKEWDNRVKAVEQKKEDRQKKRQENISKKKKEKKAKVHKAAAKRGRVVI